MTAKKSAEEVIQEIAELLDREAERRGVPKEDVYNIVQMDEAGIQERYGEDTLNQLNQLGERSSRILPSWHHRWEVFANRVSSALSPDNSKSWLDIFADERNRSNHSLALVLSRLRRTQWRSMGIEFFEPKSREQSTAASSYPKGLMPVGRIRDGRILLLGYRLAKKKQETPMFLGDPTWNFGNVVHPCPHSFERIADMMLGKDVYRRLQFPTVVDTEDVNRRLGQLAGQGSEPQSPPDGIELFGRVLKWSDDEESGQRIFRRYEPDGTYSEIEVRGARVLRALRGAWTIQDDQLTGDTILEKDLSTCRPDETHEAPWVIKPDIFSEWPEASTAILVESSLEGLSTRIEMEMAGHPFSESLFMPWAAKSFSEIADIDESWVHEIPLER